ncbi:MAG: SusC/RagA family TonB-linked outer membrane protein [Flavobacteriaceae bacterium]|nr:MAG: SusC/RagA family TonB-linked outer membrane protein [Flavobacteriaceae bacterium]
MKSNLRKSFLLPILILIGSIAYGQTTVKGTVSDSSGPLPGVTVQVKGTSTGTQTDLDGNYTITVQSSDAVLVFSYLGYTTQEVPVGGQTIIDVTLAEDSTQLDEIVVIGYGKTTIKDATGSVSSVTSESFNKGIVASPEQLIQGKTAGVQITQATGEPGAGIAFRIRGSNSIRSNNNPLFVVDGIPLSGGGTPAPGDIAFGGGNAKNPLNFINPNDIESINILKDASATAIYGSRGANGVVIIVTKSGKGSRQGKFELNSTFSVSEARETYDLLNGPQYLAAITQFGGDSAALNFGSNTDWQDVISRRALSVTNDFSYSRSYRKGNVRATFSYGNQEGIIENSGQERITGRINAQHLFFKDKLTLNLQASISRVNDDAAPISSTAGFNGDLIGAAYLANPTWPDDPTFDAGGGALNPANLLNSYQSRSNAERYLINFSAGYKIIDELSTKVNLGYDKFDASATSVFNANVNGINRVSGNGQGSYNVLETESKLLEWTANYVKEFGVLKLDAVAGYSYQDFQNSGFNSQGWGFGSTDLNQIATNLRQARSTIASSITGSFQSFGFHSGGSFITRLFPTITNTETLSVASANGVSSFWSDTFDTTDELQSFFARANLTFKEKYLLTATVRADGSSRFGSNNRYGFFPSGAFAWKLDQEDFIGDTFSTLKLRVGAGIVGNQDGLGHGNFALRQRFVQPGINDDGSINTPGLGFAGNDNPDLKWESTLDLNFGFDFGFDNDRFSGSIDIYRKETRDLLFFSGAAAPALPPFFVFQNLSDGKVINQGVELGLNYDFLNTEDSSFSTSFNISYNHNEITGTNRVADIGPIRGAGLTNAFAQRIAAGQSLFSFYMAEFTGLVNGLPTYADVNGDGVGDPALDKKFVGKDALPDFNAGLSLTYSYKNFDVSASLASQFGGFYVYNATANAFFTSGSITTSRNVIQSVVTSGENPGTSAEVSTRYLEKGDFIRLQSLSVGYNLPLKEKTYLKSVRLTLTGQNLFLITGYKGLDPEVTTNTGDFGDGIPSAGIDYAAYPRPRIISGGINITF